MVPPSNRSSRVLVVDEQGLFRAGVKAVLAPEGDLAICGECGDGETAIAATRSLRPDLVVIDLMLGRESSLPLFERLLSIRDGLRLLVVSAHDEAVYAARALKAGAHGYAMKNVRHGTFVEAVRTVLGGELWVSNAMRSQMLKSIARGGDKPVANPLEGISTKELAVLQMIGSGMTVNEIAGKLGRSQRTVEAHRNNIRIKMGLPTSSALVRFASQWVQAGR